MTVIVEAIYEQGALRLMGPISFAEGTRVEVIVIASEPASTNMTPAKILATIAAMPL